MLTRPDPNPLPPRCPRCKTRSWYALEDAGDYTCLTCGEMWYAKVRGSLDFVYNWRLGEHKWLQSNSKSRAVQR